MWNQNGVNENALVICRTILHDLSFLVIRRTMQINGPPTDYYYMLLEAKSGNLRGWWVSLVGIKLHTRLTV